MPESATDLLTAAFTGGDLLRLVLSARRRTAREEFTKVVVRPVEMRGSLLWQFTFHFQKKVIHENLAAEPAARRAAELLAETFEQGALATEKADHTIRARPDGTFRITASPPSRAAGPIAHNRAKSYLIPEGVPCPFLIEIGVMSPGGQVRRAMYHKFRQINRFLELVEDIVPALPADRALRIIDFGCGKSYLTFALHHLLTAIHGRSVRIVGLDRQPEVIRACSDLAGRLHCDGLEFQQGDIAGYDTPGPVDLAVALHACDTATDAALAQAVRWNCAAILAVPCCQHELAPRLRIDGFSPLTRHGILHDRLAALATDALRAQLLEISGYVTQVVEFIDMEHTPKNVLIRGVRRTEPDDIHHAARLAGYRQFLRALGLETCFLEQALGLPAAEGEREVSSLPHSSRANV
jgi:SAM-dependent methyltransferase